LGPKRFSKFGPNPARLTTLHIRAQEEGKP